MRKWQSEGEISANMLYRENRYRGLQQKIDKAVRGIGKTEETLVTNSLYTSYKQVYQQTMQGLDYLGQSSMRTWLKYVNANFKGANFREYNKSKLRTYRKRC